VSDYDCGDYGRTTCPDCSRTFMPKNRGEDGRCASCAQPEPQVHSAALLREWAAILGDVIALNRDEHPERVAPIEAKCAAWLREADELERRVA
jgi:hypothetical protein